MSEKTVHLVYEGGLTLSFRAGGVKQRIARGVPFAVDEATAAILLGDPAVHRAVPAQAINSQAQAISLDAVDLEELSVTDLKVLATNLGLHPKARATKPELLEEIRERIETEMAKRAEAEPEVKPAEAEPEPDGGPVSTEADQTTDRDDDAGLARDLTSDPIAGTIHLQDIPASGRIQQG